MTRKPTNAAVLAELRAELDALKARVTQLEATVKPKRLTSLAFNPFHKPSPKEPHP